MFVFGERSQKSDSIPHTCCQIDAFRYGSNGGTVGLGGPVAIGGGLIGIVVLLVNFLSGGDVDLSQLVPPDQQRPLTTEEKANQDELAQFTSVVLKETEDVWHEVFAAAGREYGEPKFVLYSGTVSSACGSAGAATGPFYCPGDHQLYLDLSFYDELRSRFGALGDLAMAYVVAHEVGHHVQALLGISENMEQLRAQGIDQETYNAYSVRFELQADYFAGVWAHHTAKKDLLEAGDIDEALSAANAIGDDRIQRETQGRVIPGSFTHGTSAQRMYWFKKGYESGDLDGGDTFNSEL